MTNHLLISVHMPKAAGTSCLHLFEEFYGEKLLKDYDDKILHKPIHIKRKDALLSLLKNRLNTSMYSKIDCIHGHFMPIKYRFISPQRAFFLTWLRHPVQRLISHYYYWMRETSFSEGETLRRKIVHEEWSLERFCLSEELRDIYSRFLWGFPLRKFNFIGITEFFDEDMRSFSEEMFRSDLKIKPINLNPNRDEKIYTIDDTLRKEIENFHKKDMVLYEEALALRLLRL